MVAIDKSGNRFTFNGPLGECHYPGKECGLTPVAWLIAVTKQAGFEISLQEANRQAYGWTEEHSCCPDDGETMTMRKARCEAAEMEARERALGLGQHCNAGLEQLAGPPLVGYASGGPRTFTREEVLTVLRAQRATWREERTEAGGIRFRAACEALGDAMGIFERME